MCIMQTCDSSVTVTHHADQRFWWCYYNTCSMQTSDPRDVTVAQSLLTVRWLVLCDFGTCITCRPPVVWLTYASCTCRWFLQVDCDIYICTDWWLLLGDCNTCTVYIYHWGTMIHAFLTYRWLLWSNWQDSVVCKQCILWHIPRREAGNVWCLTLCLESQGCHLIVLSNFTLLFFCLVLLLFPSCHCSANKSI